MPDVRILALASHLGGLNEPFCTVFPGQIAESITGSRIGRLPNQTANYILELGLDPDKVVPVHCRIFMCRNQELNRPPLEVALSGRSSEEK
jgi:hypothetical protein